MSATNNPTVTAAAKVFALQPPKKKPESKITSLMAIVAVIGGMLAVAYATYRFHECGEGWFVSVLKGAGTNCLATMLVLGVIVFPLTYWYKTSKQRDVYNGVKRTRYLSKDMAEQFMPRRPVGQLAIIAVLLALLFVFTRTCRGDGRGETPTTMMTPTSWDY